MSEPGATVVRDGDTWSAGGHEVVVRRWPTGVLHARLPQADAGADVVAALLAAVAADVDEALVTIADPADAARIAALAAAGFAETRREGLYEIPVAGLRRIDVAAAADAGGFDLVSAADVDLDVLRALDEELREDVPGSAGWRWDPDAFRDETFGADFDPRTYLVAVDRASGACLGLLRVWMSPGGPRLGCLAVTRACRRTRVAAALLSAVAAELASRGVGAVTTDVSDANRAPLAFLRRAGARRTGSYVELTRPARDA